MSHMAHHVTPAAARDASGNVCSRVGVPQPGGQGRLGCGSNGGVGQSRWNSNLHGFGAGVRATQRHLLFSAEQRVVTILGDDEAGSLALVAVWSGTVWHRCLGDLE